MKKALIIFITGFCLLLGALSWEYLFDRQDQDNWVGRFEDRLHKKEAEADERLKSFKDSVDIDRFDGDEDLIFAGFKKGEIFFWTNKIIGMDGLYERLNSGENFIKINNAYYEVRRRDKGELTYFALLHIKDSYPYNNKYVKNRFGNFLDIGIENADNIEINQFDEGHERVIRDRDGNVLFYLRHNENYKDHSANYILLLLYLLFFISLFYVYDILLENAPSLKIQLIYILGFIFLLAALRYFMLSYHIPESVYRLPLFDHSVKEGMVVSIGDLLLSAFSLVQVLYISFANLKIDYQNRKVKHYRYFILTGLIVLSNLYVFFLNYSIRSLIEHSDVYLNIAKIIDIGIPSFIAFVAIIMGGLGLIIIIDGSVNIGKNLIPLSIMLKLAGGILIGSALICYYFDLYIHFWGCIFLMGIYLLVALNRYVVKRDIQRSIYLLCMFLLSMYVVLVTQKYEQYRELTQRLEYATELIEERDYNFERKLAEISTQINDSEVIADLVANYNEEFLKMCLTDDLLDLNGYNYASNITLCRAQDSLIVDPGNQLWDCNGYFGKLIQDYGYEIPRSNFYSLVDFDGFVSYIGKFVFGDVTLYLQFDSNKDSEGSGYPQILSRKSVEGENVVYPYSYAKYKNGQLIYSSGDFNYYKTQDRFGDVHGNIEIIEKDDYSHMLIPVDNNSLLVMSLHASIFSLYYLNVLYAFFVCILLSSYGVFFSLNHNINFRKGTLKARIKNSIISLIFILFVILTALSIYLNTKNFENRHKAKATELLKYINKELEHLACVEYEKCPEIMDVLTELSEILTIDINIYSDKGLLVATSRPEIFSTGFDGYLVNATALEQVIREGAMSYVGEEKIGELAYMAAYMPLVLEDGKTYILNVPYFTQNDELNLDIVIMVIIAVNIAIVVMVLAFILSGVVAERVTKPLQMVNDKLKEMRIGGKNEKIDYHRRDEVGGLVREYNNMVEKLEASVNQLAKSERESAWREMARQIAHEIKNPLTPMKLNIQFMQRSLQIEDMEEFRRRFKDISALLIEQIDNMASIASAFSDFAKIPVTKSEEFEISEMVNSCVKLFEKNVDEMVCDIQPGIYVFADREQMRRVFINVLKNAEQSIPEGRRSRIEVSVSQGAEKAVIRIKDNGTGISPEIREKIFEPNFTTKTSGTGLGLAISKRIMESMGGTIRFVSHAEGTEFIIALDCMEVKTGKEE